MPEDSQDIVIEGLLRRLSHMQQLLSISRNLNATLDLPHLLKYITETAADLTHTEASAILLLDPKTDQLRFAACWGLRQGDVHNLALPVEDSLAGMILSAGRPLVISDVQRASRYPQELDARNGFVARAILGAPLEVSNRQIGAVEVMNKRGEEPFTDDDREALTIFGSQAAVAIENARLFEQSDAISDIVHELRTPLTSVIGYSKLLLVNENLTPAMQRQFAATIHRESSRLGDMVNGYLDLARLISGRSKLKVQPTDLSQLINEVVQLMQPQAGERQVRIMIDDPLPAAPVCADPERIRQALIHLIGNAIKYNRPDGTVTLALRRNADDLQLTVSDTGHGIEPEDLPHIFDKFFRAEDQEGRAKGTGLGLAIVKQIVEMHGGAISAASTPAVGSTFTVTLPTDAA